MCLPQPRVRRILILLLAAIFLAQAGTSICGAECVEHQLPGGAVGSMSHCHSMDSAPGPTMQGCFAPHSICSVDLLARMQAQVQVRPLLTAAAFNRTSAATGLPVVSTSPQLRLLRSSTNLALPVTALRV